MGVHKKRRGEEAMYGEEKFAEHKKMALHRFKLLNNPKQEKNQRISHSETLCKNCRKHTWLLNPVQCPGFSGEKF